MAMIPSGAAAGFVVPDALMGPAAFDPTDPISILLEQARLLGRLVSILSPPQVLISTDWNGEPDGTQKPVDLVSGSFNGFVCNLSAGFVDVWFGGIKNTSHPDLTFGGSTTSYQINLPKLDQYPKILCVGRGGPVGKLYISQY